MFEVLRRVVNQHAPSRLTIVQNIATWTAPPVCALCQGEGQWIDEPWGLDLCVHCEAACPLLPAWVPAPHDTVFGLFQYEEPVDQLITRLKFAGELSCARLLGTLFARAHRARAVPLPSCLVPMPLHTRRYRERGFNQSLEIARHIAHRLRLRVDSRLLYRQRHTGPQSELDAAARARNVAGAFALGRGRQVPRFVALVDDVMTTGSTAAAATQVLKGAGCERVELWVCARALRRDKLV
jgi:ComF family protein